ncbi:MAG: hypothetical protein QXN63_00595 [Candidatus Bathyarchaeia archaeon]
MAKEKIVKAIESARCYVENAMKAMEAKNEKLLADMLWHVSAELEYALFLFSIILENKPETFSSPTKDSSKHTRQVEERSVLASAQRTLEEAKELVAKDELDKAYQKTWQIRGELLKFQELLEKKRKRLEKSRDYSSS